MRKRLVRSTAFVLPNPLPSSRQATLNQERIVGELLMEAYPRLTGFPLVGNTEGQEPPDRLFESNGLSVGVEMFQLEALYPGRSLLDRVTNYAYEAFERAHVGDRYLGIAVSLGGEPIDTSTLDKVAATWTQRGVKRGRLQAGTELANLVLERVSSTEAVPHETGLSLLIDEDRFPALSALGRSAFCRRTPTQNNRRTDGRGAPFVDLFVAFTTDHNVLTAITTAKLRQKIQKRRYWPRIDRAVLVAHEIPRSHVHWPIMENWEWILARAIRTATVRDAFDEIFLITKVFSETKVAQVFRRVDCPTSSTSSLSSADATYAEPAVG